MALEREHLAPEPVLDGLFAECHVDGERWYEVDRALSRRAGHHWPVRVSGEVASLVTSSAGEEDEDTPTVERLYRLLWVTAATLADAGPEERFVPMNVLLGREKVQLWGCIDTTAGLAVHILTRDGC